MKKLAFRHLAKFGTAAAILSVAGLALASSPTLTASYTGSDGYFITFHGCNVGWEDTIETYLSTDSTCTTGDTKIDTETAGKFCQSFGQWGTSYSIGCDDTGDYFWICSYDVNLGEYTNTVALGEVPGCIGGPASTSPRSSDVSE